MPFTKEERDKRKKWRRSKMHEIDTLKAKHPEASLPELCKKVGISTSTYYDEKRGGRPAKWGRKKKAVTVSDIPEPTRRPKLTVVIGDADDVADLLRKVHG